MSNIDTIMLFAAGRGTRMYPLTIDTPKPLIQILNRPILYWVLDCILTHPFKRIIINTHYLADQIEHAVHKYFLKYPNPPEIIISHEEELLETGGGVKNNLKYFESEYIMTINSDSIILANENPFQKMIEGLNNNIVDIMMLVHPTDLSIGYTGAGDFFRENDGRLYRLSDSEHKPFMNAGIHLIRKSILESYSEKIFSIKRFYLDDPYKNKIYSVINQGSWLHATSPEDVTIIETTLKNYLNSKA